MRHQLCYFFVSFVLLLLTVNTVSAVYDPKYPYHPNQNTPFVSSNLPVVVINLNAVMASKEADQRIDAIMTVVYRTDGTRNYLADTVSTNWNNPNIINYRGHISIKYRGNSSFNSSPKKPFSLKTQDAAGGSNVDVNMLGIGADKDWDLLAPYNDRSMIRDMLIFDLMRPHLDYTPAGKYCEVVLNGVYQGIYIMTAKVDRGDNRIDIPKPGESGNNLTGGYHLEIDRSDEPVFWSNYNTRDLYGNALNYNTCYQYKYPESEDYQSGMQTQKSWIENRVHQMENTIAGNDFKDPERGYRKEVDVTSIIDFMLAQEFTHNVDGYRLSSPFYKYRDNVDPRFKFTIWDFNITMGNADYYDGWSTEGWQWNMNGVPSASGDGHMIPFFFKRVLEDDIFRMEMRERWLHFRETNFSNQNIQYKIDSLQTLLTEASSRNFTAWNYNWNGTVWPNYYKSSSWADEITFLRAWINKRLTWMDAQLLTNRPANLIKNSSFDSDMKRASSGNEVIFSCWILDGNIGLSSTLPLNGIYSLSFRGNNASARQILTELNKGKYTLKAWIRTVENPQARVIITPMNGTPVTYNINNGDQFHEITVPDIQISSGVCDVKFETYNSTFGSNTRVYLDSVTFFQQPETEYAYHPNTVIDMPSTNLPVMLFNVTNGFVQIGHTETTMSLINRSNGMRNRITDLNATNIQDTTIIPYHNKIYIEIVPSDDDKKSFILYTKNSNNSYQDVNLLGLGLTHKWTLTASTDDPTFLRGIIAGNLLQGTSEANVSGAALELLINDIYQGIYILTPQLDIAQTLQMNMPQGANMEENAFVITLNDENDFGAISPNIDLFGRPVDHVAYYGYVFPADVLRTAQMEALTAQYFHTFESSVTSNNNYITYIDTTSFYHYLLSMELFRNSEACRTHLAIAKKSNGKLQLYHTGLLSTTGNKPLYDVWSPEGWAWNFNRFDTIPSVPFWFTKLLNNTNFHQGLSRTWHLLRTTHFSDEKIDELFDFWQTRLTEAYAREVKAWGIKHDNTYYQLDTWEEEITAFKQFLHQRAAWIDSQLLAPTEANLVANGNFEADMPRNNSGDLLISSWEHGNPFSGNITSLNPFEGNRSYSFAPTSTQIITQILTGYYKLNFHYKTVATPMLVNLYSLNANHEPTMLLFTDTLEETNQWTAVSSPSIFFEKGVGLLQFSTYSAIPEAIVNIDNVSLTFGSGTGINTLSHTATDCKVYPNPFNQSLYFEYTAQSTKSTVTIFTTTGLQIAQLESDGMAAQIRKVQWQAAHIASGIYFYQIRDGEFSYTGKIIKQ